MSNGLILAGNKSKLILELLSYCCDLLLLLLLPEHALDLDVFEEQGGGLFLESFVVVLA